MNNSQSEPQVTSGAAMLPGTEARFHRFQVGDIDCISLSDGAIRTPLGPPPSRETSAGDHAQHQPDRQMELRLVPLSCLLVALPKSRKVVLMDSGFGFNAQLIGLPRRSDGRLIESLGAAGISPESIDIVLISHFDPDHIGGLFHEDGSKQFPHATYFAAAEEVAFWSRDVIDLSGSPSPEPVKLERLSVSSRLLSIAGRAISTFRAGQTVIPEIISIALPGHTPGQVGFIVEGQPESLLYMADSLTNSVVSVQTPHVHNPMDLDPQLAVASRRALIELMLNSAWQSFAPHFPWPGIGRVVETSDGAAWEPAK